MRHFANLGAPIS